MMKKSHILLLLVICVLLTGGYAYKHAFAKTTTSTTTKKSNLLPLGDKKISTKAQTGYIWSCGTHIDANGGGAGVDGPWITGAYWDPSKKTSVTGSVYWNNAKLSIINSGSNRLIVGNGLPVKTPTGIYPVGKTDPAYAYDRNPNSIKSQTVYFTIPKNPTLAKNASCIGGGGVGITLNGVTIFDGLDALGRDAVAHEVQDNCSGHPEKNGQYHYHSLSKCFKDTTGSKAHSDLVGYALDGFGIYGPKGENGKTLTNADLDACHGHTHEIMRDGKKVIMYHYHTTAEYPYTVGCFRGAPVKTTPTTTSTTNTSSQPTGTQQWPQEPFDACKNKSYGAACSFKGKNGETVSDICRVLDTTTLVCGQAR